MKLYTANINDLWPIYEEDIGDRKDVYVRLSDVQELQLELEEAEDKLARLDAMLPCGIDELLEE